MKDFSDDRVITIVARCHGPVERALPGTLQQKAHLDSAPNYGGNMQQGENSTLGFTSIQNHDLV